MSGWRIAFALGFGAFVVAPLAVPFRTCVEPSTWKWDADDVTRLLHLTKNTFILTLGTAALAMPVGVAFATLLFRTSFIGRRFCMLLLGLMLFVPLPVLTSSWQGAFGADGWLPLALGSDEYDRPWATGMLPAILVHALASVPWVAFIVGLGLSWVEPELEEEAALSVGPWRVLTWITLPRVRASLLAVLLFVVLQTANEISVTDMMVVRTLAEEVYTQFAEQPDGLGRTVALSLPVLVVVWGVVLGTVSRLEKTLPPLMPSTRGHRGLSLAPAPMLFLVTSVLLAFLLAPMASLVWKLGLVGYPGVWSGTSAWHYLQAERQLLGSDLLASLGTSLLAGLFVAFLSLAACWLARDSRWFRWLLFSVAVAAWVIPGPVVGIGLLETIHALPPGPLKDALYYGPSPLPLIWAQSIRALPIAMVFLWPVVRQIPRELLEEAWLTGATALGQWFGIIVPLTWRAGLIAALASTALCLAEIGASTRVETPGWASFCNLLFERMHRGVDNNVSALCVLLLASLAILGLMGSGLAVLFRFLLGRR